MHYSTAAGSSSRTDRCSGTCSRGAGGRGMCWGRWGQEVHCQHGDFFTCGDRFNPGLLQRHKWESCQSIDK